jgi:hypothetical protein
VQLRSEQEATGRLLASVTQTLEARDRSVTDAAATTATTIQTCLQAIKGEGRGRGGGGGGEEGGGEDCPSMTPTPARSRDASVCELRVRAMAGDLSRLKGEESSNAVTLAACQVRPGRGGGGGGG